MFQVFAIITLMDSVSSNGCVLVICPLKSIIRDQIEEAESLGLNAVVLESPGMFENNCPKEEPVCRLLGQIAVQQ